MDYFNHSDNQLQNNGNVNYVPRQPAPERNKGFIIASMVLGILSILFSCVGFYSIPFASLSILFAILAYRKGRKMNSMAVSGIITSCIGIIMGILVTIWAFWYMSVLIEDGFLDYYESYLEETYGEEVTDLLKDFYGVE